MAPNPRGPKVTGAAPRILSARAALFAAALIAVGAGVGVSMLLRTPPQPHTVIRKPLALPPAHAPVAGIGVIRQGEDAWRTGSGYRAYAYLIVGVTEARLAAREPGRSLVYFAGTDVNTRWDTGVPYVVAARHGWLLRDSDGNLLVNRGYPDNYVGDVGNRGYQRAWLANVLAFLRAHGDKGVFIDDVLRDLRPLAGAEASRYPTRQAWAAAQRSFLAAVGPPLRAHGYYVLVNASGYVPGDPSSDNGTSTADWWRQLAPYVSGLANEYFAEVPDGSNTLRASGDRWNQNWDGWQHLVVTAQSLGKDFVGLEYGPAGDTQRMSYGKASFLLEWNGGGGAFIYEPDGGETNPWNPAWTVGLGAPAAPKQRIGSGWLRRYSDGVALVNPSSSSSQRFDLGRPYRTLDGETLTRITLPPVTGAVLTSPARARASAGATGRARSATSGRP